MKANEAPEKLYISYKGYGVFSEDGSTERTKTSQIEYTRTDAFIEKAAKWINEHTSLSEKLVIENFINYMEGE
jgi:hypothetical protein